MSHKDFIEIHDYSADEVREILEIARDMKANREKYRDALKGKTLAMIFEKSSTRTRVSFEVGMFQMGGHALFLSSRDIQIGRGEPAPPFPPPPATSGRGAGSRSTTARKSSRATSTASWPAPSRTRRSPSL